MSGVDALTAQAVVVLQDRPLVSAGPWLNDAQRLADGRALQVVTPPTSRLSLALRTVFGRPPSRWVVRADDGSYYEGLTGRPLRWDGAAFVHAGDGYAPAYVNGSGPPSGTHLALTFRTAPGSAPGAAVERLFALLTGYAPAGWGPVEPIENPWRREDLAAAVAERPSRVLAVGGGRRACVAVMEFGPGPVESTSLVAGFPPEDPPQPAALPELAAAAAAASPLTSLLAMINPGRADLTFEPRWTGAPSPLGLAMPGARTGPADVPSQRAGDLTWFELGPATDSWQRYQRLLQHLRSPD
ncbi:hypothetical protein DPM19_30325 [Actinomadura craniellae]|uniref:Uncharacterized protein n=1 Tax=Actinomadura craniellae TaxID=2231787 RepID=A0A365GWX0_9ACTN|nr:DUF6177 family protein [Actinomadura craniellae]RAY11324.1 hypothetical protein DPM19_30325 [Actinomadura craniellae]